MTSNTLQNRVDPWGALCATASRGTLMGNRGILHDDRNRIVRPWAHRAWVTCLLEFNGIKRSRPFSPGNYSELFFIDEATAFSAGHRPCAHCQRLRHREFKDAWVRANVAEEFRAATLMPDVDKAFTLSAPFLAVAKGRLMRRSSSCPAVRFSSTRKLLTLFRLAVTCRGRLKVMVRQKSWMPPLS